MPQQLGSSSSIAGVQSQENQVIADLEGMLSDVSAKRTENDHNIDHAEGGWVLRRLVPIILLAGIGAALALVPMGLKSGVITGRSVAQSPPGR